MGKMTSTKTLILAAMASAAVVGIALPSLASAQDWRNQGQTQASARSNDQTRTDGRRQNDNRGASSQQRGHDQSGYSQGSYQRTDYGSARNDRGYGDGYSRGYREDDRGQSRDDRYDGGWRLSSRHSHHDWHRNHRGW